MSIYRTNSTRDWKRPSQRNPRYRDTRQFGDFVQRSVQRARLDGFGFYIRQYRDSDIDHHVHAFFCRRQERLRHHRKYFLRGTNLAADRHLDRAIKTIAPHRFTDICV